MGSSAKESTGSTRDAGQHGLLRTEDLLPFYSMIPTGVLGQQILIRAWVPIDDEHTMFWNIGAPNPFGNSGADGRGGTTRRYNVAAAGGREGQNVFLPDTSDWLGKFRIDQTLENDYLIDRQEQKTGRNYTGISGIFVQDQCVTETMGAISNRSAEHLGMSDQLIIRSRRHAIRAVRDLCDQGRVPHSVDHPEVFLERSGGTFLPRGVDWWEGTMELRKAFTATPMKRSGLYLRLAPRPKPLVGANGASSRHQPHAPGPNSAFRRLRLVLLRGVGR